MCGGFWLPFRPDEGRSAQIAPRKTPQERRFSPLRRIRRHNGPKSGCLHKIDRIIPFDDAEYRHLEGNSAAHIKAILVGASAAIPITGGRPTLGTWQGIFFCEFDGPRSRHLFVKAIAG